MIITFLDGSKKEFEVGSSALDIANSISSSLAKKSIFALVNGEEYDLTRHNIGFMCVDNFAQKYGADFKVENKFKAEVSRLTKGELYGDFN